MKISEFVKTYISGAEYEADYEFSCVWAELKEVFTARSLENLKEELNDVSFTFQSWLHLLLVRRKLNWDWTMICSGPSIAKMQDRLEWWTKRFEQENLKFHPAFWYFGSNYKKRWKVEAGLLLGELSNARATNNEDGWWDNFNYVLKELNNDVIANMQKEADRYLDVLNRLEAISK